MDSYLHEKMAWLRKEQDHPARVSVLLMLSVALAVSVILWTLLIGLTIWLVKVWA